MLLLTRQLLLQQIQFSAVNGYVYYTAGKVHYTKLEHLMHKFDSLYSINMSRMQAYRKKKKGEASARFFCYPDLEEPLYVWWVLMLTEGSHPAKGLEDLKDLRTKPTRIHFSDYVLVQKPSSNGKPSFTWRLTSCAYHYYCSQIRKVVRAKNELNVKELAQHIGYMPGFSGVRSQKKKLQALFQKEATRHFPKLQYVKFKNLYLRLLKVEQVRYLKRFFNQMEKHDLTVIQQLRVHRGNLRKR